MALNPLVDSRDTRFVLFELLEIEKLTRYEAFSEFDRDTFQAVIDLAEQIATEQIYPANAEADKIGAQYNPADKSVKVPEVFNAAMAVFNEAGFTGLCNDPRWGGMGMPDVIYRAVMEYFFAASVSFTMNVSLLVGATNLVKNFGVHPHRDIILEKMISGEWGGTMCLTEPDAGSDVGALKTKAVKQDDGTYLINGQKIFISAGENDTYENIIHPVLARVEGDPPGTRGISIFLVPKIHVNADGSPGEPNDVVCSGIEHKMGIKASPTATLNFGDNGQCVGWLMGGQCEGMKIMFQMMNEARLDVALQGLGVSSSAYMHAITYAKNRVQGADPEAKGQSARIIQHPDVKRMLLWMKSHVEAMRITSMLAAYSTDVMHAESGETAKEAKAMLDLLIPICKAGNTDMAWLITAEAIMVYGGYGYCSDYPVEQLARDAKILAIYEGTNGIQSMDLIMRKLLMNPEMYIYSVFKKRVQETIDAAGGIVDEKYISAVKAGMGKMDDVIGYLSGLRDSKRIAGILEQAVPLQQSFRMLVYAWLHLWSMTKTIPALKEITGDMSGEKVDAAVKDRDEAAYYYGKVMASRFYIGSEFKKYFGNTDYILSGEAALSETPEQVFTGAPAE